ncbi:DNA-directed RNA polymerase subunit beta [Chungangia koreensis]|uniref:DNA-directed RNA polymerase subunit beta n=1 Tax=Chungangia koreensis TaxID=752657 RepID=A0ABV8X6R8_9LACT
MIEKMNDSASGTTSNRRIERKLEEKPANKTNPFKRFRKQKEDGEEKRTVWVQIRLFPIWVRILIVLLLLAGAAAGGLVVGYGIVGDGEPANALKWDTWIHLLNIIQGKES